jgi:ATP-binding cassette subfamily B protein
METKRKTNIAFILKEAGSQKYKMYLSVFFSVVSGLCKIFPYILLQVIIVELLSASPDKEKIQLYIFICFGTVGINILFLALGLAFSHIAAFSILFKIRENAIDHMGKLGLGFFQERSSGQIKKALDEDIEKLELFIAHQIPDLAESIITPLVVIIYLMQINFWLSLILFIPFLLSLLLQAWIFKGYEETMTNYNQVLKIMHGTIVEYIHGMRVFKAFNLSATNFKKYTRTVDEYLKYWIKICDDTIKSYTIGLTIIDTSGLLLTIPVGGLLYLSGKLDFSGFVMFLLLSTVFLTAFLKILSMSGNLARLLTGADNIREMMEVPALTNGDEYLEDILGEVAFQKVTFAYDEKNVLENLSFTLKPNTVTALVGPSGSGKTTVGMLLGRFWDISQGSITIDGKELQALALDSLMEKTAFVFQDVFMLNDTILNNIRLGMDKTEEEVFVACQKAQIHDFILTLPNDYGTVIGEKSGIKLSGGEKQRIAIARALLKDAQIVILDEVTAYSDIENEKNIQLALRNLLLNRTGLIIAHRLYTIQNVDQILVLDEGQLVEQGTHRELLAKEGLYQRLWQKGGKGA